MVAACLAPGCTHQPSVQPALVKASGDWVSFTGPITSESAERFFAVIDAAPVARVRIASGGGEVEPAIRMAEQIYRRGLDVEVIGPCFSSCANYIFPVGRRKIIASQGIVAWHGNLRHLLYLHETGAKPVPKAYMDGLRRNAALESHFFQMIGVDEFVCWFAKVAPYKVHNMYFMSAEDMARFGIGNVTVRADYAATDLGAYKWGKVQDLRYVQVDWAALSRPAIAAR